MEPIRVVILITGTPGTGKSTVSKLLSVELRGEHIELTRLVKEWGLSQGWDETRSTTIADMKALRLALANIIGAASKPVIVDGHYSPDVVSRDEVTLTVVLRRAPWVLREELKARGYGASKIQENVEAELLGTCLVEALAAQDPDKVREIDTTGTTPDETVKLITATIDGEAKCRHGTIDWMNSPEVEKLLKEL
jgi:adenylate kinase